LPAFQRWHQTFGRETGLASDAYLGVLNLQSQVGELAHGFARILTRQRILQRDGMHAEQASQSALAELKPSLRAELAGCLAHLLELANDVGIDLETAYLQCIQADDTGLPAE
jgi:hypothetical protein